jgi:hypothetical protein
MRKALVPMLFTTLPHLTQVLWHAATLMCFYLCGLRQFVNGDILTLLELVNHVIEELRVCRIDFRYF